MIDARALLGLPPGTRRRSELQPLLYSVLEREGQLGALSGEERDTARRMYYWSLARSVSVRDTLALLLDEADAIGVPVLPLKGALLGQTVYPDAAARPMGDVDVAVLPSDLARLVERLIARGYQRFGVGQRRYDLEHTHHLIVTRGKGPAIELHVRLLHELGADGRVEDFFARAARVAMGNREVLAPSWDDHAFYVALHAASHGYADSPLWLADLGYLWPRLTSPASLVTAARDRQSVSAIHFAIAIASRYLPRVQLATDPPTARSLREAMLQSLLGSDPLALRPGKLKSLLVRFAVTDRLIDVGRAAVGKIALHAAERFIEPRAPHAPTRL